MCFSKSVSLNGKINNKKLFAISRCKYYMGHNYTTSFSIAYLKFEFNCVLFSKYGKPIRRISLMREKKGKNKTGG